MNKYSAKLLGSALAAGLMLVPSVAEAKSSYPVVKLIEDSPCLVKYGWDLDGKQGPDGKKSDEVTDVHYKSNSASCNPNSIARDVYADTDSSDKEADFRAVYFANKASFKGLDNSKIVSARVAYDAGDADPDYEVRLTLMKPVTANPSLSLFSSWQKAVVEKDLAFDLEGKPLKKDGHWNERITKMGSTYHLVGGVPNSAPYAVSPIGIEAPTMPELTQLTLDQHSKTEFNFKSSAKDGKEDEFAEKAVINERDGEVGTKTVERYQDGQYPRWDVREIEQGLAVDSSDISTLTLSGSPDECLIQYTDDGKIYKNGVVYGEEIAEYSSLFTGGSGKWLVRTVKTGLPVVQDLEGNYSLQDKPKRLVEEKRVYDGGTSDLAAADEFFAPEPEEEVEDEGDWVDGALTLLTTPFVIIFGMPSDSDISAPAPKASTPSYVRTTSEYFITGDVFHRKIETGLIAVKGVENYPDPDTGETVPLISAEVDPKKGKPDVTFDQWDENSTGKYERQRFEILSDATADEGLDEDEDDDADTVAEEVNSDQDPEWDKRTTTYKELDTGKTYATEVETDIGSDEKADQVDVTYDLDHSGKDELVTHLVRATNGATKSLTALYNTDEKGDPDKDGWEKKQVKADLDGDPYLEKTTTTYRGTESGGGDTSITQLDLNDDGQPDAGKTSVTNSAGLPTKAPEGVVAGGGSTKLPPADSIANGAPSSLPPSKLPPKTKPKGPCTEDLVWQQKCPSVVLDDPRDESKDLKGGDLKPHQITAYRLPLTTFNVDELVAVGMSLNSKLTAKLKDKENAKEYVPGKELDLLLPDSWGIPAVSEYGKAVFPIVKIEKENNIKAYSTSGPLESEKLLVVYVRKKDPATGKVEPWSKLRLFISSKAPFKDKYLADGLKKTTYRHVTEYSANVKPSYRGASYQDGAETAYAVQTFHENGSPYIKVNYKEVTGSEKPRLYLLRSDDKDGVVQIEHEHIYTKLGTLNKVLDSKYVGGKVAQRDLWDISIAGYPQKHTKFTYIDGQIATSEMEILNSDGDVVLTLPAGDIVEPDLGDAAKKGGGGTGSSLTCTDAPDTAGLDHPLCRLGWDIFNPYLVMMAEQIPAAIAKKPCTLMTPWNCGVEDVGKVVDIWHFPKQSISGFDATVKYQAQLPGFPSKMYKFWGYNSAGGKVGIKVWGTEPSVEKIETTTYSPKNGDHKIFISEETFPGVQKAEIAYFVWSNKTNVPSSVEWIVKDLNQSDLKPIPGAKPIYQEKWWGDWKNAPDEFVKQIKANYNGFGEPTKVTKSLNDVDNEVQYDCFADGEKKMDICEDIIEEFDYNLVP